MGHLIWILIMVAGIDREKIIRSCLCHTIFINFWNWMYHRQRNCRNSCFLLLIFLLRSFFALSLIVPLQSPLQEFSSGCLGVDSSLTREKENWPKWPFVVTCCHSLSFVVTPCTTRCHSLRHLLSFVVTLCTTRCHLLWLDVSIICLFINDLFKFPDCRGPPNFKYSETRQTCKRERFAKMISN